MKSHELIRKQIAHVDSGTTYTVAAIARVRGTETWIMRETDEQGEPIRLAPHEVCPHGAKVCSDCMARDLARKREATARQAVRDVLHEEANRMNEGRK